MGKYKKNRKPSGWWTLEHCKETAQLYSTPQELKKAERGCHHIIMDRGWQEECFVHMVWRRKRTNSFSKEELSRIAKKYSTYEEFKKKDNCAYVSAKRQGFLEEICSHMPPKVSMPRLSKEACMNVAKKYKTRSEFRKSQDSRYYNFACRKGFIDEICSHMEVKHNKRLRCIYVAEFPDHSIYVGLTCHHQVRWTAHLHDTHSTVYKYCVKTGLSPQFYIVHDYCDALKSKALEKEFVNKYMDEGRNVLNIAKAGALGTLCQYTKADVIKQAKKYKTLTAFRIYGGGYYQHGYRSDYWDEIIALFPHSKLTHHYSEDEIMAAAIQCKTRGEFQKRFKKEYQSALRQGIDKFCTHMRPIPHKWSDDELWDAALRCKTRWEFQTRYPKQYSSVMRKRRLDEFCAHMNEINHKWTIEEIREAALKCKTRAEFQRKYPWQYRSARKHGLDRFCEHMAEIYHVWTNEEIRDAALQCNTKKEFKMRFPKQYKYASTKGVMKEFCSHMTEIKHQWTDSEIINAALQCKTRGEFKKRFRRQYNAALRQGIDKFCKHMEEPNIGHQWTDEEILSSVLQCKTYKDFQTRFPYQHAAAMRRDREKFFAYLAERPIKWTKEKIEQAALQCKSKDEFKKRFGGAYKAAKRMNIFKDVCAHMG